jgi:hypothetical protein
MERETLLHLSCGILMESQNSENASLDIRNLIRRIISNNIDNIVNNVLSTVRYHPFDILSRGKLIDIIQ